MSRDSKPIRSADESAKELIIEVMGSELTGGFDVDSIYFIEGRGWVILEFLRCIGVRPFESHPNRYWEKNHRKFESLNRLVSDLDGELVLVNYEDSREQFLIIEVEQMDEHGIHQERKRAMDCEEFREFFLDLNRAARRR